MVSYYNNSNNMYRHQQVSSPANPSPMHSWYSYHQGPAHHHQMPPSTYCMQEEQQMWHHHPHHAVFHTGDFQDFHSAAGLAAHHHVPPGHQMESNVHQMPSPTVTVSGSDMSSPGAVGSGNLSPPAPLHLQQTQQPQVARPPPARSPFEWIKKQSYLNQPNPEIDLESVNTKPLDFTEPSLDTSGKTRTKDKYRVVYTDLQRIELEKEFTFNNRYITIRRKSELATNLGLSERQIKIWFQNRRAKERKQNKKRLEESKVQQIMEMGGAYPLLNQQHIHHPGLLMHGASGAPHHHLHHQQPSSQEDKLLLGLPADPLMMESLSMSRTPSTQVSDNLKSEDEEGDDESLMD